MNIQWFPGHMAKTRRLIKENLTAVDAVCELVDARIPESSRNPELDEIVGSKPRIVLLNKCDLADENATARKIKELSAKAMADGLRQQEGCDDLALLLAGHDGGAGADDGLIFLQHIHASPFQVPVDHILLLVGKQIT